MSDSSSILAGKTLGGPASARLGSTGGNISTSLAAATSHYPACRNFETQRCARYTRARPSHNTCLRRSGALHPPFDAVERAASAACGSETCVYFPSGYLIGVVALASLEEPPDLYSWMRTRTIA